MKSPRYPHPRKSHWFSRVLGACAVLLCVTLGYHFLGPEGGSVEQALTADAQASTGQPSQDEYPNGPLPEGLTFDRLLLEKSLHKLTAFSKDKPVRVYYVALGTAPVGHKQFQGDKKTPEGIYTINGKNPNSAYHKNLGVSYPNAADREFARKQNKSPGGDIKIHGLAPSFADLGASHRLTDWTFGCIAVTNPEIDELYARTPVGVSIEIRP